MRLLGAVVNGREIFLHWRFTEWSRREPSDIYGKPERVSELARANQTAYNYCPK